jgi:preprotein translocase subunit SecA
MQHLENMDHLREGIRWYGVGQRDPLVEYRRQSQLLYDDMSGKLRFDVVRHLFHARPINENLLNEPVETDITRAAKSSISNANKIIEGETLDADDFTKTSLPKTKKTKTPANRRKAHKAERKRRAKGRRR